MKVATIVGARPQFIKTAPLSIALHEAGAAELLIHTGQHFDAAMSDVFFDELKLPPPAYHLGIHGGGHGAMTGAMLTAVEPILQKERPDVVVVYGDTNSTLAGALAAAKLHIPVAHVEAGLRSFNRRMPEEINRVTVDHVSDILFCPTVSSVEQLRREGIIQGVQHVGDVMFDALLLFKELAAQCSRVLERLGLRPESYAVATIHRAENTGRAEQLGALLQFLRGQSATVVLPVHPRTRQAAAEFGLNFDGLTAIEPLGYLDMIALVSGASAIYTDSGGLQKEAYFLGKSCVTLRDETEWVETVSHGWNRLWKVPEFQKRRPITEFGTGQAARAIVRILSEKVLVGCALRNETDPLAAASGL